MGIAAGRHEGGVEWPTVGVAVVTYAVWALAVLALPQWQPQAAPLAGGGLAVLLAAVAIAQHSSLTHEVIHGHPFRDQRLNVALVALPLALCIPYGRFRDQHLAHHHDEHLTDPYDDPESNYLDPAVWAGLPPPARTLLRLNNTLAGRIVLGPVIGTVMFLAADLRAIWAGDRAALAAWVWHLPALAAVLAVVALSPMAPGAYAGAVWLALGLLRIRTFLEHRAHEKARARTVVIEDRGPFALLFLNNNYHVVHHMHPQVAWYRLPALYRAHRAHYLARNAGYRYGSYGEVFRAYLLRAKDPVPHPLWPPAPVAGHQPRDQSVVNGL